MYQVSEAYKTAMRAEGLESTIRGTIGNFAFTAENILLGSFSVTNQCHSNSSEISIGQAYIGMLKVTFLDVEVPRNSWEGMDITPYFGLKLADGTYEYIPIGVFTVSEANWTESGMVVTAYDQMARFTKTCSTRFTNATPYDMLTFACTECGVTLGNTPEQIEAMTNGTEVLTQHPESDIETWQDALYWIAQTLGGFATIGRDGKLYIRHYNQIVVDTINPYHRYKGCSFSDFTTRYTGISVVNMDDDATTYYGLETDDALTYNLGSNPFLQYGGKEQVERRRRAVLQALTAIDYTPFKAITVSNPVYDLGDVIEFTEGLAGTVKKCCVTSYTFQFHKQYTMSGAGKDPATANAKSKTDKNIEGLINKVNKDTFRYDVVRNGREVDVADQQRRRILRASLLTNANALVEVKIEILLDVSVTADQDGQTARAIGSITYQLDSEILERNPVETWDEGKHILTLIYMLTLTDPGFHVFDIFLQMDGGSVTIGQYDILCIFSGIGIAATQGWNGRIEIEEDAPTFAIPQIGFANDAVDSVALAVQEPDTIEITDEAPTFAIPQIGFDTSGVTDAVAFNKELLSNLTWDEAKEIIWNTAIEEYIWGRR